MDINLKHAIDNPEKFYWNDLMELEDDFNEIGYSNSLIYLSVLFFLVSNQGNEGQLIDNFLKRHRYNIEDELQTTKEYGNANDKNLIKLCEKFPIIRDVIYKTEKKALSECVSLEDYINYTKKFKGSCREFILYAKYQISLLGSNNDLRFDSISEVINSFPYSDLFDIEYFKTLCEDVNGVSICFSGETTEKQRETVVQILSGSKYEEKTKVLMTSSPLTKLQIIKLLKYDEDTLQSVITNIDKVGYLRRIETYHLLTMLTRMTGLLWTLPSNEIVNKNEVLSRYKNKVWIDNYNESDSSIVTYYALQPIIKTTKE